MPTSQEYSVRAIYIQQEITTSRWELRPIQNGVEKASRRLRISYTITPEEILHDRLVFGIHDVKVRERLLRECQLTLKKTDEICLASESTVAQLKEVRDSQYSINFRRIPHRTHGNNPDNKTDGATKECSNYGRVHTSNNCITCCKTCSNCGKINHFAVVCRSGKRRNMQTTQRFKALDEELDRGEDSDEIYVVNNIAVVACTLDDTQLVMLRLTSGNFSRWSCFPGIAYGDTAWVALNTYILTSIYEMSSQLKTN